MIPFYMEFYGYQVDNFRYIIDTALNESIIYHDLFNYTLDSVRWTNYKYILDGLTNRIPQGSFEYQFSASAACAHLYNYLNSSHARYIATIGDVPHSSPYIYTSNDIAWIASGVIITIVMIILIVWIVKLPHNKRRIRPVHVQNMLL